MDTCGQARQPRHPWHITRWSDDCRQPNLASWWERACPASGSRCVPTPQAQHKGACDRDCMQQQLALLPCAACAAAVTAAALRTPFVYLAGHAFLTNGSIVIASGTYVVRMWALVA